MVLHFSKNSTQTRAGSIPVRRHARLSGEKPYHVWAEKVSRVQPRGRPKSQTRLDWLYLVQCNHHWTTHMSLTGSCASFVEVRLDYQSTSKSSTLARAGSIPMRRYVRLPGERSDHVRGATVPQVQTLDRPRGQTWLDLSTLALVIVMVVEGGVVGVFVCGLSWPRLIDWGEYRA